MDRGAWRATVHGVKKQIDVTWQLNGTGSQWHSPWQRPGCVPSASPVNHPVMEKGFLLFTSYKWPHWPASSGQQSVEWGQTLADFSGVPSPRAFLPPAGLCLLF